MNDFYKITDPHTFTLVSFDPEKPNYAYTAWVHAGTHPKYDQGVWVNENGGFRPNRPEHVILEVKTLTNAEMEERDASWEHRMLTAGLDDHWKNNGWVTPEGQFLRCDMYQHDLIVTIILGKVVRDVEKTHLRVCNGTVTNMDYETLTDPQAATILDLNLN